MVDDGAALFRLKDTFVKGWGGVEKLFGFRSGSVQGDDIIIIVLLGLTGSGRSTFINTAIGEPGKLAVEKTLLQPKTTKVRGVAHVRNKRKYVFIDTPGLNTTTRPQDIALDVSELISRTYSRQGADALIYLQRVSDPKVTDPPMKFDNTFKMLCGDDWKRKTILATTMWGAKRLDIQMAEERERQLASKHWKEAMDAGAKIDRFSERIEDAWKVISRIVAT